MYGIGLIRPGIELLISRTGVVRATDSAIAFYYFSVSVSLALIFYYMRGLLQYKVFLHKDPQLLWQLHQKACQQLNTRISALSTVRETRPSLFSSTALKPCP